MPNDYLPQLQFPSGLSNSFNTFGAPVVRPPGAGQAMVPATVASQSAGGTGGSQDQGTDVENAEFGFLGKIGGIEGLGTIMKGVGSLGEIYASLQALKLGREQLKFGKEQYQTNLANQTQTYNTSLEDRTRARFHTEGKGADQVDAYLAKHSL